MTRVLVITSAYPPEHLGGYELSCRDVVDRWRAGGHEVLVLTGRSRSGRALGDDGVRRELVTYFDGERFERWKPSQSWRSQRHDVAAVESALAAFAPDVVSVWQMAGIPLGVLTVLARRSLPVVAVVCDEWPGYILAVDPWMRHLRHLRRWPRAWAGIERATGVPTGIPDLDRAASFCFVSHDLRDRSLKWSPWMFPRSTVTYSGIDPEVFPVGPLGPPTAWRGKLVAAGRLDPRKGFDTAVEALVELPDSTLEIVSAADGSHRRHLEAVARERGVADRVAFVLADRAGLRDHFAAADAVVFPSVWREPFGLVPLEAMATGVPVVATGTGGSAEFLEDGRNCLRFPPADVVALAAAVRRLAGSPQLRRHLVAGGLETARQLSVDTLAAVLEDWHLAAADGFRAGVPGPPRDLRSYRKGRVPA